MDYAEFIMMVAEMRKLQKDYFRYRDPLSLQKAKKAEALVDAEIKRMTGTTLEKEAEPQHPTLF
jgi:hypothetical protein